MKKLKMLSFTLAALAIVVVLASFKSSKSTSAAAAASTYLDYKPAPVACKNANGTIAAYTTGCKYAQGYYCNLGSCPYGTTPVYIRSSGTNDKGQPDFIPPLF